MPVIEPIAVQGLAEFRRALRDVDADLPKAIRVGLNTAVQIVVAEAQPRIPHRTGRAAATVRGQSTQAKARVKAGGRRAPYFPWLDFGGRRVGRGGGVAVRQFRAKGRYVWLAFGDRKADVMEGLRDALVAIAKQAGLEVSIGGQ